MMDIADYLAQVAYVDALLVDDSTPQAYFSKFDDSYITHVGMENNIKFLAELEITEDLTSGVGFSPKENKWYGWSHRAICGFTIGSTCSKGDCHYLPKDKEDFLEKSVHFWEDAFHEKTWGEHTKEGVRISWLYNDKVPNKELRGTTGSTFWPYPDNYGKGEWVAQTMADAKQMAIDFNQGIS